MFVSRASLPSVAYATFDASTITRRDPLSSTSASPSTSRPTSSFSDSSRDITALRPLGTRTNGIREASSGRGDRGDRPTQRTSLVGVLLKDGYGLRDQLARLGASRGRERASGVLHRRRMRGERVIEIRPIPIGARRAARESVERTGRWRVGPGARRRRLDPELSRKLVDLLAQPVVLARDHAAELLHGWRGALRASQGAKGAVRRVDRREQSEYLALVHGRRRHGGDAVAPSGGVRPPSARLRPARCTGPNATRAHDKRADVHPFLEALARSRSARSTLPPS